MALGWNLSDITDWETVCFNGEGDDKRMSPETEQLITVTMVLGLNEISQENIDKFCLRLRMYEKVCGWCLWYTNEDGSRRNALPDSVVKRHIGLHTNASRLTDAQFNKWILKMLDREAKASSSIMERDEREAA